ncbi:type II toxin-antitoxin system RelE/ParE family toxin [Novosphingobium sp. UBA1939]|uniref:type II toxin-antitoxin system RelE/ParE family toxin n=1 Tax=Novosphingobium sp. UBA1939 TaxID=1946982 RepID=UPI0025D65865|nr:type II toxin-antitoxin system RelE/ParE family toxin [Novosphingobium sp. UBA1939]
MNTALPYIALACHTAMPYRIAMHTVVETPEFLSAARKARMSDEERLGAIDFIAANPEAGDLIPGTGGCRKVRIARQGKGKSGGYRVVTYYTEVDQPVFLLTVISKGKQANLTDRQKNELKKGKQR